MHSGVLAQYGFDLTELNAKATDLHLVIYPTEKRERLIREAADQVASFVEPEPLVRQQKGWTETAPP